MLIKRILFVVMLALLAACQTNPEKPSTTDGVSSDLSVRIASSDPQPGHFAVVDANGRALYVTPEPVMNSKDFKRVDAAVDQLGEPVVILELSEAAVDRLAEVSEHYKGKKLAIMLGNKVLTAPVLKSRMSVSRLMISGLGSAQEVDALVQKMRGRSENDSEQDAEPAAAE